MPKTKTKWGRKGKIQTKEKVRPYFSWNRTWVIIGCPFNQSEVSVCADLKFKKATVVEKKNMC
jgi:hypothetical protein